MLAGTHWMTVVGGLTGGRLLVSVRVKRSVMFRSLTSNIGNLLLKRLLLAIPQAKQSREDFFHFDKGLREEIPHKVVEMEKGLAAWIEDKSCPDPYRVPKSSK